MLRLLTLNLNQYGDKHGAWTARKPLIEQALANVSPDIVAFQAVRGEAGIAHGEDQAYQLCAPTYPYITFMPTIERGSVREGLALAARLPVAEVRQVPLAFVPNVEDSSPRALLLARIDAARPLYLVNAHFSWVPTYCRRNAQEAALFLQALPGPAVMVGDLNARPDSEAAAILRAAGLVDAWAALHPDDPGFTFEADAPSQRIDYAWLNTAAAGTLTEIEQVSAPPGAGVRLSDHLGLAVTLSP